jgi:hypothetical protein
MFVAGGRCLSSAANPKAKILCGTSSKNSVRVAKLPNFKELIQMSKSRIEIQAFAMKSTPDILCFFQCEPVGGHENAQESREEQNLGETIGSRNVRNINKLQTCVQKMGSIRGRSGVLWDHSGEGKKCVFSMGYKNFEVPEGVYNQNSTKMAKV